MKTFNPLIFLSSLGAGGIAVAPFVYFQYITSHGKGLVTFSQLMNGTSGIGETSLYYSMQAIMIVFAFLHFALTIKLLRDFISWKKSGNYTSYITNPEKNTGILAIFTSLGMTFNVFIGVVRFFIPALSQNFQSLMLPALLVWSILWLALMFTEIKLLKHSFHGDFDISNISFGWLLHPFALGMVTVAGSGIAAMAHNPDIANTAAFMSIISGSMGMFLLGVKLISIFKSHFAMKGMPERQFLPSFLIVIPITTIYAISFFRIGHYIQHQFNVELPIYSIISIVIPFAFQTWYFVFGLAMLKDYFKKDFFRKEYYVTLWAFICPFVGYSVLGSFFYKLFMPNILMHTVIFASLIVAIVFFVFVGIRYIKYEHLQHKVATNKK
ncbi:MAG: hypothetical protein R6U95_03055 [Bacteroidales bacterium]